MKLLSLAAVSGVASACTSSAQQRNAALIRVPAGQSVARFPEKEELILLTDRPPQLEPPLFCFRQDFTPNEAFFVRWHFAGIPTTVDLASFRLNVKGHVEKPLSFSVDELKSKFEPATVVAVLQCSGNSRSFFQPPVPGGQWQNGAVGNARWKGVRLKDLLKESGVKAGAVQVSFAGLDEAPLSNMPKFVKALDLDHAMSDEIIVAYEMNDAALPMVNGFPLRLVVPGWFATYWVKALNEITVLESKFDGYWMEKAYRIPKNEFAEETPDNLAKDTVPINRLNIRSFFVRPDPNDLVRAANPFTVEGVAFDSGAGISKIEISEDGGSSWKPAKIISELGNFAWYRWQYQWTPVSAGNYRLMVRATSKRGEVQTSTSRWNKGGYMRNVIEALDVKVI